MPDELGLPSDAQLVLLMREGLPHGEIQAVCERVSGRKLAQATISAALSRAALLAPGGLRFYETVPWRVQSEHLSELPVRMLRRLARQRAGVPLDDDSRQALGSWLAMLEREGLVVAYCPFAERGFVYVGKELRKGPNPDVPIRVPPLPLTAHPAYSPSE